MRSFISRALIGVGAFMLLFGWGFTRFELERMRSEAAVAKSRYDLRSAGDRYFTGLLIMSLGGAIVGAVLICKSPPSVQEPDAPMDNTDPVDKEFIT